MRNTCIPVGDPDCPVASLAGAGRGAWEEAAVDRVEAGALLCIEARRGRT